jgi:hypothetical protein
MTLGLYLLMALKPALILDDFGPVLSLTDLWTQVALLV